IENELQNKHLKSRLLTTIVIALILYAGQPETSLYVLLLGFLYALLKLFNHNQLQLINIIQFFITWSLGFFLAAPQILLFLETINYSIHLHPIGGEMGVFSPTEFSHLKYLLLPSLTPTLSHYKVFPHSGKWDWLGGYISIICWLLVSSAVSFKKITNHKHFLYFAIFGFFILLNNFRIPPFYWIGYLPLFDQVWTPRWAGCIWTFCLSVSCGIAADNISLISTKRLKIVLIIFLLFALSVMLDLSKNISHLLITNPADIKDIFKLPVDLTNYNLNAGLYGILNGEWAIKYINSLKHFFNQSIIQFFGVIIFFYFIMRSADLSHTTDDPKSCRIIKLLIVLAVFELWFYIPKGYNYLINYCVLIPLFLGWGSIILFKFRKLKIFLWTLAIIIYFIMETMSDTGIPKKHNPFKITPTIMKALENKDYYRCIGLGGVLMPNYTGAYKLYDVRYINAVSPVEFNYFFNVHLLTKPLNRFDCLWFTGMISTDFSFIDEFINRKHLYSWLGVKYIFTPKNIELDLPLLFNDNVKLYENPDAYPRAYILYNTIYADNFKKAQNLIVKKDFDLKNIGVVEDKQLVMNNKNGNNSVKIIEYKATKVKIKAISDKPGILVLTDNYYPTWECYLNKKITKFYRINGLVRGVPLPAGEHIIEFNYFPSTFIIGCILSLLSLVFYLILFFVRENPST
ncbi:MAG: YfhO family protein, partial [Candidatus Hydrogenedentota bacterium]